MADTSDQPDERGSKPPSSDKLPRAHKRCINKECREVMSLATKVGGSAACRGSAGALWPPARRCRPPVAAAALQAACLVQQTQLAVALLPAPCWCCSTARSVMRCSLSARPPSSSAPREETRERGRRCVRWVPCVQHFCPLAAYCLPLGPSCVRCRLPCLCLPCRGRIGWLTMSWPAVPALASAGGQGRGAQAQSGRGRQQRVGQRGGGAGGGRGGGGCSGGYE